jgi:hypothetical protein
MRHLGWLHATPEGSKVSRLKSYKALDENSSFLKLPKIEGAEYLVSLLHEAGLCSATGMGIFPLPWQEIESWLEVTGLELSTWEKLMIKEMSEAYVGEYNQASAKDRPAPYTYVEETIDREAVANKLKSVFRSMKRKKEPKDE